MKRSKVFKIKNQDMHEDTAFEREFRVGVVKQNRERKDEKFILLTSILVMFLISIFTKNLGVKTVSETIIFIIGVFGILL